MLICQNSHEVVSSPANIKRVDVSARYGNRLKTVKQSHPAFKDLLMAVPTKGIAKSVTIPLLPIVNLQGLFGLDGEQNILERSLA